MTTPSTSSAARSSSPSSWRTLVGASLLAVVGPSGSGKSSVVRAGLLPALAGGVLSGSQNWTQAVIRPGEHPLRELRRARAGSPRSGTACSSSTSSRSSSPRASDEGERTSSSGRCCRCRDGVVVVAARRLLRALRRLPELSRALGANHVLVGAMSRDELRRAIERPAQRARAERRARARRRAARRRRRPARCAAAAVHGTARAAGAGATGAACSSRPTRAAAASRARWRDWPRTRSSRSTPAQQAVARRPAAAAERRGPRRRGRAPPVALDRRRRPRSSARLTERRLLTVSDGTVEVAHEALLREWPRLRGWLDEDAEGRRLHRPPRRRRAGVGRRRRDAGEPLPRRPRWPPRSTGRPRTTPRADARRARVPATPAAAAERARPAPAARWSSPASARCCVVTVLAGAVALDQRNRARDAGDAAAAQRLGARRWRRTSSTARCCSRARASRSRTRRRRAATCSPRCSRARPRSVCCRGGDRVAGVALSPDERTLAVRELRRRGAVSCDTKWRRPAGSAPTVAAASRRRLRSTRRYSDVGDAAAAADAAVTTPHPSGPLADSDPAL